MDFKRKSLNILLCIAMAIANSSCKKFLDILPSTQSVNPTTIKEFQEILNNDSLSSVQFFPLDMMTDDVVLTDQQYAVGDQIYRRLYQWESTIWIANQQDFMYNNCYSRILQMNVILDRIKVHVPGDQLNTPENRSIVISQAMINRAWYYLQLVNTYGPAYDAATAQTDPGVPLILVPDPYALKGRATVEEVYNSIIADLRQAVNNKYLPAKGIDIIHPGKSAGYGLLARAYLYKQDYNSASLYADSALALSNELYDLNAINAVSSPPGQLIDLVPNPEVLLGRLSTDAGFYDSYAITFTIGQSLLDSLGGTFTFDKRFTSNFNYGRTYKLNSFNTKVMAFNNSVSVPEIMLIKAECLARSGNVLAAAELLTLLRSKRLPANQVSNRTYTTDNILPYVLGERRRELCFRGGLRLFDLKRLNKESRFKKDLTRLSQTGTVISTLPAGSPKYLLPFSPRVIAANPNITQNPR